MWDSYNEFGTGENTFGILLDSPLLNTFTPIIPLPKANAETAGMTTNNRLNLDDIFTYS